MKYLNICINSYPAQAINEQILIFISIRKGIFSSLFMGSDKSIILYLIKYANKGNRRLLSEHMFIKIISLMGINEQLFIYKMDIEIINEQMFFYFEYSYLTNEQLFTIMSLKEPQ